MYPNVLRFYLEIYWMAIKVFKIFCNTSTIFFPGLLLASLSLGAMLGKAKTAIERWLLGLICETYFFSEIDIWYLIWLLDNTNICARSNTQAEEKTMEEQEVKGGGNEARKFPQILLKAISSKTTVQYSYRSTLNKDYQRTSLNIISFLLVLRY